jgi:hypothetical protein
VNARIAAVLAWLPALGFGLPGIYGTWYFADRGEVWTFLGFPTYGDGPFEQIGLDTSVLLLVAFLLVCALEVVLGWWLWRGRSGGRLFSLVLLPVELAFWIGFALPFGPLAGIARTALVLVGGRTDRGS